MVSRTTQTLEVAALWLFGALPMAVMTGLWLYGFRSELWPPTPGDLVFGGLYWTWFVRHLLKARAQRRAA